MFLFDSSSQDESSLNQAYCDLLYLLDRGFPKKSALMFVANHYTLDKNLRNILNRAVLPLDIVHIIQNNLLRDSGSLKGTTFHIDAYNQLTTFYSLNNRDPVIICRDGVLRDIFSSLHAKKDLQIDRKLLIPYFKLLLKLKPGNLHFYFDKQISFSKEHVKLFSKFFQEFKIVGSCDVYKSVDWCLKNQTKEVVLSHDSTVLTEAPYCFDFFSWILKTPSLYSLSHQLIIDFQKISCP
ncbi:MAG: DUF434 domain-containing protein [Candidatus Heimdallarchaeota archaeon]|nr:MAG: DUF434 domain-containing protein [Candidatus Heimdallarchaeota archaeon]